MNTINKSIRLNSRVVQQTEAKETDVQSKDTLVHARTLKRRSTILEKSRDWARRFMTLGRSRRATDLSEIPTFDQRRKFQCEKLFSKEEKRFDEDGYLSPLEIKAQLDEISRRSQSTKRCSDNVKQCLVRPSTNCSRCKCQMENFVEENSSEFDKSLSTVDYIDFDVADEEKSNFPAEEKNDESLVCLRYLFSSNETNSTRRIPRRTTNISSISSDSGFSESSSIGKTKLIPVQLVSCTLLPVNIESSRFPRPCCSSFTYLTEPMRENCSIKRKQCCSCRQKFLSKTMERRVSRTNDDISRWFRPDLSRNDVAAALQQADYGAFVIRFSSTHPDCVVLSIKVPKFTHESNIVHYLIEKIQQNSTSFYRIKGGIKRFPTLLSLLTHHSVMPEILPITLNLYESVSN